MMTSWLRQIKTMSDDELNRAILDQDRSAWFHYGGGPAAYCASVMREEVDRRKAEKKIKKDIPWRRYIEKENEMAKHIIRSTLRLLTCSKPLEKTSTCKQCKAPMPKGHIMYKFLQSYTDRQKSTETHKVFWSCGATNCSTITHDQERANRVRYLEQTVQSAEQTLIRCNKELEKMNLSFIP